MAIASNGARMAADGLQVREGSLLLAVTQNRSTPCIVFGQTFWTDRRQESIL